MKMTGKNDFFWGRLAIVKTGFLQMPVLARIGFVALFIGATFSIAYAAEVPPSTLTTTRDGGVLYPGEVKVIPVPVQVSQELRVVSAKHGCGCMFTADIPSILRPKQDNILQIGLVAGDQEGDVRVGTVIEAAAGDQPFTILTNITAKVLDPIRWHDRRSPKHFEFPTVPIAQDHQQMSMAFSQGEHPMRWQGARIEVVTGKEWLDAELSTSGDQRLVTLSRRKTGYYGVLSGRFGIHLSDAEGKALPYQPTYLVQAKVEGGFQARPAMAFFGAVHQAEGDVIKIRLRSTTGHKPEVENVHVDEPGQLKAELIDDLLHVALPAQLPLGKLRTHVDVHFRDGGILRIPVMAHIIE